MAASTARTVCIRSTSNPLRHDSSVPSMDSALTLATRISRPPSSRAASASHDFSAGPSATSSARPVAFTPLAVRASSAAATSPSLRAHIAMSEPSSAMRSAIARPMPLVPPVMSAFLPCRPKSISFPRAPVYGANLFHSAANADAIDEKFGQCYHRGDLQANSLSFMNPPLGNGTRPKPF